jgi:hypothetical protein
VVEDAAEGLAADAAKGLGAAAVAYVDTMGDTAAAAGETVAAVIVRDAVERFGFGFMWDDS